MANDFLSILYPDSYEYKTLSDVTCHDIGLDNICKLLSDKENEQRLIMNTLSRISCDEKVANYRSGVFEDILAGKSMREELMKLLDRVQFLKDFGSFKRDHDKKAGIWDLLHRLEEINEYIDCVESIKKCLDSSDIKSDGLLGLKKNIENIYNDCHFSEMKEDIKNLKADTSSLKSITVGININERFEATQMGLISVNNKAFKHSGVINNFSRALTTKGGIHDGNEWNGDMHFSPVEEGGAHFLEPLEKAAGFMAVRSTPFVDGRVRSTIVNMPEGDANADITHYMNKVVDSMLSTTVKKLRDILSKYVSVTIVSMTELIPELIYYIRFAEFVEKYTARGMHFCKAHAVSTGSYHMKACGLYNIKLATSDCKSEDIVTNDLDFDPEHMVYILTGANRGGKTTITQAIGQLFVLAQGGIYVPATEFEYAPVDNVFTHFPADEDKTMDLGRLGEECTRFKELYAASTEKSLLLLNESFSTTSFEEGYYIAKDCVRAILDKKSRTIYNTHMHKLASDIGEINESSREVKAASLVVKSDGGNRSFKVIIAPPEGMSYASDIAAKYGVTYDMLTK